MITKTDFDGKLSSLNKKYTKNKSKHILVENELKKLNKYFEVTTNTKYVWSWKSKGLSDESVKPPATSDNSVTPLLIYCGTKTRVLFDGDCLKQNKVTFNNGKIANIYIVYEIIRIANINGDRNWKYRLYL